MRATEVIATEKDCLAVYDLLREAHKAIKAIYALPCFDLNHFPADLMEDISTVSGVLYMAEGIFVSHPHQNDFQRSRKRCVRMQEAR